MSFRFPSLTPSFQRVCTRFKAVCTGDDAVDLGHLVFLLLAEESIGGACLIRLGLTMDQLAKGILGKQASDAAVRYLNGQSCPAAEGNESDLPQWFVLLTDRAVRIAKRGDDDSEVRSEHLVLAITEIDGPAKSKLSELGISHSDVRQYLKLGSQDIDKIDVDLVLSIEDDVQRSPVAERCLESNTVADRVNALLDANLNRAREGLRVLEDFARFVVCCPQSTERLKQLRHNLVEAEKQLRAAHPLISKRDVEADAGTQLTTSHEMRRSHVADIVTANSRRIQEAIRSLEEFGKLVDPHFSATCKQIRYSAYECEQVLSQQLTKSFAGFKSNSGSEETNFAPNSSKNGERKQRRRKHRINLLNRANLYVLLSERLCHQPWKQVAEAALRGGADILQLREKYLSAEELIARTTWLQDLCCEHDALLILNDQVAVAAEYRVDGVHIGQTDMAPNNARKLLSPHQLLGLSTHDVRQLQAVDPSESDYVGVGPIFPTETKCFDEFCGPEIASEVSRLSKVPWFAIGGIVNSNLDQLLDLGVHRIAVCGAVISSEVPEESARNLATRLRRSAEAKL